jgi:hypothetical protein
VKAAVSRTTELCVYGTHRRQVFGTAEEGVAVLAIDFACRHRATHRQWGNSLVESGFCIEFCKGPRKRPRVKECHLADFATTMHVAV